MQKDSNYPGASQGPSTSESNNLPIPKQSSGSALGKPKSSTGCNDVSFSEQPFLVRPVDHTMPTATSKVDRELLAQNRGNAMQRYKEKKKTRRYITKSVHSRFVMSKLCKSTKEALTLDKKVN